VKIQTVVLTDDSIGGKEKSFVDFKTVWAIVKAVPNWRRLEIFQAQKVQDRMQQMVTIRYIEALADNNFACSCQVVIDSRKLNVTGVVNLHDDMKTEGKAYQTLLCVEGEAA